MSLQYYRSLMNQDAYSPPTTSANFTGTNGVVTISNNIDQVGGFPRCVSFWYKKTATGTQRVFIQFNNVSSGSENQFSGVAISITDTQVFGTYGPGNTTTFRFFTASHSPVLNDWGHYAFYYNSFNSIDFQFNNGSKTAMTYNSGSASSIGSSGTTYIGFFYASGEYATMKTYDMRYFNSLPSTSEMTTIYNREGLIGTESMALANIVGSTWEDVSGFGNNGTLSGNVASDSDIPT